MSWKTDEERRVIGGQRKASVYRAKEKVQALILDLTEFRINNDTQALEGAVLEAISALEKFHSTLRAVTP